MRITLAQKHGREIHKDWHPSHGKQGSRPKDNGEEEPGHFWQRWENKYFLHKVCFNRDCSVFKVAAGFLLECTFFVCLRFVIIERDRLKR